MTAPQSYRVQTENDRTDSVDSSVQVEKQGSNVNVSATQAEDRPDSLHKQIYDVVLDLSILNSSLETISGFMQDADVKCDSCGVGIIIEQYTGKINDFVGQIEELLSAGRRMESNVQ
jgi:hypothetical protein